MSGWAKLAEDLVKEAYSRKKSTKKKVAGFAQSTSMRWLGLIPI